jgi:hypothetical protein
MGHISEAWTNLAPPGANCVTDCAMEAHRARGMFTFCMSHLIPAYKRAAVTQAEASEGYVGAIALRRRKVFCKPGLCRQPRDLACLRWALFVA